MAKKAIAVLLALLLCACMAACSKEEEQDRGKNGKSVTPTAEATPTAEPTGSRCRRR